MAAPSGPPPSAYECKHIRVHRKLSNCLPHKLPLVGCGQLAKYRHYTHIPISDVSLGAQWAWSFLLPTARRNSSTHRKARSKTPLYHSRGAASFLSSRTRSIHSLESSEERHQDPQRQTERGLMRGMPGHHRGSGVSHVS